MFERQIDFPVFYVPEETSYPDDQRAGVEWLSAQDSSRCILVATRGSIRTGTELGRKAGGFSVYTLGQLGGFPGGAVLVPFPTDAIVGALIEELRRKVTALCMVEGSNDFCRMWLADMRATDVMTGNLHPPAEAIHPVTVCAMAEMSKAVNHNNALLQAEDKSYAVLTLQELNRGDYLPQPARLAAWAAANGFTLAEVKNLCEYATKVLAGRNFRLQESWGPQEGDRVRWEEAVREQEG